MSKKQHKMSKNEHHQDNKEHQKKTLYKMHPKPIVFLSIPVSKTTIYISKSPKIAPKKRPKAHFPRKIQQKSQKPKKKNNTHCSSLSESRKIDVVSSGAKTPPHGAESAANTAKKSAIIERGKRKKMKKKWRKSAQN
jgi:hypothetical protein